MKNFFTIVTLIIASYTSSNTFCMETQLMYKPQPHGIVYAPWREDYCNETSKIQQPEQILQRPCTFCRIIADKNSTKNLVLHRGTHSLIMLASQPYIDNGIHFLIIPYEHTREISNLSSETHQEENIFTQKLCYLFAQNCHETWINTNQGLAAGASIPEHHHKHIMINNAPRYHNLIEAMQKTKTVINLPELFNTLQAHMRKLDDVIIPEQGYITPRLVIELLVKNNVHQNCYFCTILKENDALKNLIIHRGKYATAMLSHFPTYFGEIDIIPHEHEESIQNLSVETYKEIHELTTTLYPLILKILGTQDSNIGLVSYGNKAPHKEHIRQKLIPRKDSWNTTPVTKSNHINAYILKFYKKLLSEWLSLLNKNYQKQPAKL